MRQLLERICLYSVVRGISGFFFFFSFYLQGSLKLSQDLNLVID